MSISSIIYENFPKYEDELGLKKDKTNSTTEASPPMAWHWERKKVNR